MLQADDLAVGLYVTVMKNKPINAPSMGFGALFGGQSTTTQYEDRSGMGAVMAIVAVSLPFVVTEEVNYHPVLGYWRHTFDIRRTTFMAVTPEFMEATLEAQYALPAKPHEGRE